MLKIHANNPDNTYSVQYGGSVKDISREAMKSLNLVYKDLHADDPKKADYFKTALMQSLYVDDTPKKAKPSKGLAAAVIALLMALSFFLGYGIGHTDNAPQAPDLTPAVQSSVSSVDFGLQVDADTPDTDDTLPDTQDIHLGTFKLTAYCPCEKCCGQWADGITYTGTKATAGRTVAVDPDVIPLGSIVFINGQTYIAEDVGGAIDGNRIDIYFDTHQEALDFGVQSADVTIAK